MKSPRRLDWDWYPGTIPENANIHETAFIETTFSFYFYRSRQPIGVSYGQGASSYLGTMFDVGPRGCVTIGDYSLVHGARIICDSEIVIGEYTLISWNVVLMDTYRLPISEAERREELASIPIRCPRIPASLTAPKPISIGRNVWIGFDSCVLPGVTIGEGSVVGAKSVVTENVPPFTVVAGNPARFIRNLNP
jgi:acetyltransferase-like isoleucine patch superfamily enzyme